MLKLMLRFFLGVALGTGSMFGQATALLPNVRDFLPTSAASPVNPPFLSPMSVVQLGQIRGIKPSLRIQGDVSEQTISKSFLDASDGKREQRISRMRPEETIAIKYDRAGHELERYEENILASSSTRTTQEFEDGSLVAQAVESRYGASVDPKDLIRVLYAGDRVVEIAKKQGNGPQMHVVDFKYDAAGRVTRYEYRFGNKDAVAVRTEIQYDGDTVETKTLLPDGRVGVLQTQRVDVRGRVVDLRVSHAEGGKLAAWYHVSFRYDDKDRVIEQVGDPRDLGTGLDWAPDGLPQPGRVTIAYDDSRMTRTQEFYEKGRVILRAVAQMDREGDELSVRVFDGKGVEKQADEMVPNAISGKPERKQGKCAWEIQYDSQGNWIERALWFTPADGGVKVLLTQYERTIGYR